MFSQGEEGVFSLAMYLWRQCLDGRVHVNSSLWNLNFGSHLGVRSERIGNAVKPIPTRHEVPKSDFGNPSGKPSKWSMYPALVWLQTPLGILPKLVLVYSMAQLFVFCSATTFLDDGSFQCLLLGSVVVGHGYGFAARIHFL